MTGIRPYWKIFRVLYKGKIHEQAVVANGLKNYFEGFVIFHAKGSTWLDTSHDILLGQMEKYGPDVKVVRQILTYLKQMLTNWISQITSASLVWTRFH